MYSLTLSKKRFTRFIVISTLFFASFRYVTRSHTHYSALPRARIQYDFNKYILPLSQPERQKAVQREFMHAWTGYRDHSWMADTLMSVSGQRKDEFCGWSATLVDALDTLYIMGLSEEFDSAVEAVIGIDFTHNPTACTVSLFESTIRYLGGMLAAYDLSGDQRLLPKLLQLGDMLHSAFNTFNGMPCNFCPLGAEHSHAALRPSDNVAMADVGSLSLEFARLSQVTNDTKYVDSIQLLTNVFERTQNSSNIPGLWPQMVDSSSILGDQPGFATHSFVYSLGALSDSSYEYLVKGHLLLGSLTDQYANMWKAAAKAIRRYMLFRAYLPQATEADILFSGVITRQGPWTAVELNPQIQHLACFAGGMFALASKIFNEPGDLQVGEGLTRGCVWAYEQNSIGIMPESFDVLPCPGPNNTQCEWNATLWEEESHDSEHCLGENCEISQTYPLGYLKVGDGRYILRPEAIESVFIMWRLTGNTYWREIGWRMFQNIIHNTRTAFGHASIWNVMQKHADWMTDKGSSVARPQQLDEMESFWLAETLKYFFLLFSEPDLIDLDEWVLNTEAHPLRLTDGIRGF